MPTQHCSLTSLARSLSFVALLASAALFAQSQQKLITLDHGGAPQSPNYAPAKGEPSFAGAPANFYAFPPARAGEPAPLEELTLHFSVPTSITKIESASADFSVEAGGSCAAGRSYAEGDSCIVLARFTPQGAGRRLGRLSVSHTASAQPATFGLGGYGQVSVISFVPAATNTISATYTSPNGVLSGAVNLTVDGGDTLYISDTGNGLVRYMNVGGTLKTIASGYSSPLGIAVDNMGEVYFSEGGGSNNLFEIYDYSPIVQINGTTAGSCPVATPCTLSAHALITPGRLSIDPYNHLFFPNQEAGAAMSTVQPVPANLIDLYDPFPYQTNPSSPIAVDSNDNIYSLWATTQNCQIMQQSLYSAENSSVIFTKIAGGKICGYAGDGGQANNAEIGATIGQMAFDAAGDLYFTDSANQRVRMINVNTGIITTVLGSGTTGFTNATGNRSTIVSLSNPTGLAVDSQGQIYVMTEAPSGAATEVIQKVSATGIMNFNNQTQGTTSAAQILTVTNTGNSSMTLTNHVITGANAGDFSIDPNTTSCMLTTGSTLAPAGTCKVGILFKPSGTGTRSANLVFLDNTVTGSNTVNIYGTGTAPAPAFVPGAVSFPVTTPTKSNSMPVTITNKGNVDLQMANITLGGSNADMFSFTSNCMGGFVAPGASCTLNIAFKPSSTGSYSATLNFTDNAPNSPQAVFVSGTGQKPYTSATKLTSAANPAPACSAVTFKVAVSTSDGSAASGPVSLQAGTLTLATGTLTNGAAALTVQGLAPGLNLVTANYGGDTEHAGSTTTLSQMVNRGSCGSFHPPMPAERLPVRESPITNQP